MSPEHAQKLPHGWYEVTWAFGGKSFVSVGSYADGTRWMMATNWTSLPTKKRMRDTWGNVQSMQMSVASLTVHVPMDGEMESMKKFLLDVAEIYRRYEERQDGQL